MKKEIYQAFVSRLQEITNENTQEGIFKKFELWKPEILTETSNSSNDSPAVYIEFLPIEWKAPCGGVQIANAQIRLHITHTISTEPESYLQLLDLSELVKEYIIGWRTSDYGRVVCIESTVNHEQGLKECTETFQLSIR
ncbi:hypothetical protein [Bacteroides sp.]|uniref:hypothetical protein n=1 Tax=Bacteroides sp. TaxID=29523 RepID=UPI0025BE8643|nr:hypothetical protein [Bacteroides sp.]